MRPWLWLALASTLAACARDPSHRGGGTASGETVVKLDNFGYRPEDSKVAVFSANPGPTVQVRTSAGEIVFRVPADGGSIQSKGTDSPSGDAIWWVDFSAFSRPGTFVLASPSLGVRSYAFRVAPDVYNDVLRTAVRTFYLQRCGAGKLRRHAGEWADEAACHRSDTSAGPAPGQVNRGRRDLSGGWHDAGDYNKYVWRDTANAILFLLRAYEANPAAFPDGALDVPESGNGLSDLLDEVKWETDFLLKMQLEDGSVLSDLHAEGSGNGSAPPSADATRRYYHDPNLDSGAVFAGSCAVAARVFSAAGQTAYALTLQKAALSTWTWLLGQGDSPMKLWAAAEIFRLDPRAASARSYVDVHCADRPQGLPSVIAYETHAALAYLEAKDATPAVVAALKLSLGRLVDAIFAADDLYRNGMPLASYHWGSNSVRAAQGVFLLDAARLGVTGSHTAAECRRHAQDFLHYFHGQNPLSMVYLTNMATQGGEHSAWQIYHHWFGQIGDPYSRSRYVGKPPGVVEPDYPYFKGQDNHGLRDAKTSLLGPAPGFVPGGPNRDYSGDARPPAGAGHPNLFYRDWNDQTVWTAMTWEISENSIGYQGPYVALVAAFVGGTAEQTPHGDR